MCKTGRLFENPFREPEKAREYFEKYLKKASFDGIFCIKDFKEKLNRIKGAIEYASARGFCGEFENFCGRVFKCSRRDFSLFER